MMHLISLPVCGSNKVGTVVVGIIVVGIVVVVVMNPSTAIHIIIMRHIATESAAPGS